MLFLPTSVPRKCFQFRTNSIYELVKRITTKYLSRAIPLLSDHKFLGKARPQTPDSRRVFTPFSVRYELLTLILVIPKSMQAKKRIWKSNRLDGNGSAEKVVTYSFRLRPKGVWLGRLFSYLPPQFEYLTSHFKGIFHQLHFCSPFLSPLHWYLFDSIAFA